MVTFTLWRTIWQCLSKLQTHCFDPELLLLGVHPTYTLAHVPNAYVSVSCYSPLVTIRHSSNNSLNYDVELYLLI
jgi:hypothetical protein